MQQIDLQSAPFAFARFADLSSVELMVGAVREHLLSGGGWKLMEDFSTLPARLASDSYICLRGRKIDSCLPKFEEAKIFSTIRFCLAVRWRAELRKDVKPEAGSWKRR